MFRFGAPPPGGTTPTKSRRSTCLSTVSLQLLRAKACLKNVEGALGTPLARLASRLARSRWAVVSLFELAGIDAGNFE